MITIPVLLALGGWLMAVLWRSLSLLCGGNKSQQESEEPETFGELSEDEEKTQEVQHYDNWTQEE